MKPETKMEGHVIIVTDKEETMHRVEAMFARMQEALTAMQSFVDGMSGLDEDAPDLEKRVGPLLETLTIKFIRQYETPQHLQADLDTLRRMVIQPSLTTKGGH